MQVQAVLSPEQTQTFPNSQLKDLGFNFSIQSSSRDVVAKGLKEFLAYKRERKTNLIPSRYISPSGFRLGEWQTRVRRRCSNGELPQECVRKLNKSAFRWRGDCSQYCFSRSLEATIGYKKTFGQANAPFSYRTPEGFRLGEWQWRQRIKHRKRKLRKEEMKSLKAVGYDHAFRPPDLFERGFTETLKIKEKTGNANVIRLFVTRDGYKLGRWQSSMRCNYQAGRLAKDRIRRMERIGFTWNLLEQAFLRGCAETLKYRKSHGTVNCPHTYITAEGYRLGAWQAKTKTNYRQGILSRDQIQKLEAIGFDWSKSWGPADRGMLETAKYLEEHGTANAPRHYVTADGFKLGDWQASTRRLRRSGRLSAKRTITLKKMRFDFSIGTRTNPPEMRRRPR